MTKDIADATEALEDYHRKADLGMATPEEHNAATYLKEVLEELKRDLENLKSAQASAMGDGM